MSSGKITDVRAREILDCRGWPTVQADVYVDGKLTGRADVPAGRSTGTHEACVLADGDPQRYRGLGVLKAVANVNGPIHDLLVGMDVTEQRKIDMAMVSLDGTPNKKRMGANAILGASLACARAGAAVCGVVWACPSPMAHMGPSLFSGAMPRWLRRLASCQARRHWTRKSVWLPASVGACIPARWSAVAMSWSPIFP